MKYPLFLTMMRSFPYWMMSGLKMTSSVVSTSFSKVTFGASGLSKESHFSGRTTRKKTSESILSKISTTTTSSAIKSARSIGCSLLRRDRLVCWSICTAIHRIRSIIFSTTTYGSLYKNSNHKSSTISRSQISGSAAEQNKAIKEIDKLDKMILDCEEYERDILFPSATERIAIDLDDGVLVNYNKMGRAVKEVSGLNDKVTKKQVREFDWIDTTQIR